MPHEGYADPVMNDRSGFHSNMPVSELTKHVTQAIKASDVSLAPPVAETTDGVTHETQPIPTKPDGAQRLRTPNTLARSIPRCAHRLDARLRLARSLVAPST